MRIHLDDIPESGLVLNFSGTENVLTDSLNRIKNIQAGEIRPYLYGHLHVERLVDGALLSGKVVGSVELQCARCLVDYTLEPEVDMHVLVVPKGSGEKKRLQERDSDENVFFIDGMEFDPGDVIVQEILLALPMKPLCAEDCKGICQTCGNLQAQCSCPKEKPTDRRWAALKELRDKLKTPEAQE